MAGPRTSMVLLFAAALMLLCHLSEAQRRQLGFPDDDTSTGSGNRFPGNNRPGNTRPGNTRPGNNRPGNGGSGPEFWPGAGGSNSNRPTGGDGAGNAEFWPGAGGSVSTTTTRRPSSGGNTGCACPSTPEYNPVCGTDGVSYGNPGKLNCAKRCGTNVSILHYGNCTPADPNAPTTSTTPASTTTRRRRS